MIAAAAAAFSTVADFAGSKTGRRILAGVAALAIVTTGVLYARAHWIDVGVAREQTAQAERLAKAKPAIVRVEAGGKAITAATDQRAAQRQVEIRTVTHVLKERVPVYVTVEADRRNDLPMGFVWLHDQAAAGVSEAPAHPGVLPDASSGIALSAATDVIVDNYGTAHEWREAALACRAWAREQADLWDENIRAAPASP